MLFFKCFIYLIYLPSILPWFHNLEEQWYCDISYYTGRMQSHAFSSVMVDKFVLLTCPIPNPLLLEHSHRLGNNGHNNTSKAFGTECPALRQSSIASWGLRAAQQYFAICEKLVKIRESFLEQKPIHKN